MTSAVWLTPLMLVISNIFMMFAWYGHLKFKNEALWLVVIASWGIALIEYCFAVPANRWGHGTFTATELKTIQEVITLAVFAGFSIFFLKESFTWQHGLGFALIAAGAFFVFNAGKA
ncbi:MAG: DMT family protein [Bdellovibrionales bacterium]